MMMLKNGNICMMVFYKFATNYMNSINDNEENIMDYNLIYRALFGQENSAIFSQH